MKLFLIAQLLSLLFGLLMVVRVWRASTLDGVLTLLVPFYFIVAMIKYWNEPDHDIRFHAVALLVCAGISMYGIYQVQDGLIASEQDARAQVIAGLREHGLTISAEQEKALLSDDPAVADRAWQQLAEEDGDASGVAMPTSRARDAEFDNPRPVAAVERPPVVLSYPEAAARVVFNRGRWERAATGFSIDVPAKFHLLAANDARRLDAALNKPQDSRVLAWIQHENLSIEDPSAWYVKVRWHSDGWVPTAAVDPVQLLLSAQSSKSASTRLAGSGGDLLGYPIAPSFDGRTADWVEERLLGNGDERVLDCHAIRLGMRGVLEFSIVGMPLGSQSLCHASVRLMADRVSFLQGRDYPLAAPASESLRAPYSVASLISHAP